jgi:glutamine amidotransferase
MDVAIIDYGMGNLRSVANACAALGARFQIASQPGQLRDAERIVLPGVGAFGDGMSNLRRLSWLEVLEEEVRQKQKPFLGICLGMQLLAASGTEFGVHQGLGWIPGKVIRIACEDLAVRVPHIGWNDVRFTRKNGLYAEMGEVQVFYFVHSYVLVPEDPSVVSGYCEHGIEFAASVECDNISGTQYHPEKSHKAGLAVLRNFLAKRS